MDELKLETIEQIREFLTGTADVTVALHLRTTTCGYTGLWGVTAAMEAGLTDHVWSWDELSAAN